MTVEIAAGQHAVRMSGKEPQRPLGGVVSFFPDGDFRITTFRPDRTDPKIIPVSLNGARPPKYIIPEAMPCDIEIDRALYRLDPVTVADTDGENPYPHLTISYYSDQDDGLTQVMLGTYGLPSVTLHGVGTFAMHEYGTNPQSGLLLTHDGLVVLKSE